MLSKRFKAHNLILLLIVFSVISCRKDSKSEYVWPGVSTSTGTGSETATGTGTTTSTTTGSATGTGTSTSTGSSSIETINCYPFDYQYCSGEVEKSNVNVFTKIDDPGTLTPFKDSTGAEHRCWLKFDLSGIPGGAVIQSAQLYVYITDKWDEGSGIELLIEDVPLDPVTGSGQDIYTNGSDILEGVWGNLKIAWNSFGIDSRGVSLIQNSLSQGWFALRIMVTS